MSTKSILIVSGDLSIVQQLCRTCEPLVTRVVVSHDTAYDAVFVSEVSPDLLCIDGSGMSEAELPRLFQPYVREAGRRGIPVVVLMNRGQHLTYGSSDDLCVYCLAKGSYLLQGWSAVLCELLDVEPQSSPARSCI